MLFDLETGQIAEQAAREAVESPSMGVSRLQWDPVLDSLFPVTLPQQEAWAGLSGEVPPNLSHSVSGVKRIPMNCKHLWGCWLILFAQVL